MGGAGAVTMPAWAMTLIAMIIIGLLGLVWRDLVKRIDSMASKLDGHVGDDGKAHERITVLETRVATNTERIQTNYDKFHRFQVEMREASTTNYKWLVEEFSKLYRWFTEQIVERGK